jgi:uncharacterized protein YdaL
MRHYRALAAAVAAVTLAAPLAAASMPASAAQKQPPATARPPGHRLSVSQVDTPSLPAPPLPGHGRPVQRSGYRPPTGLVRRHPRTAAATGGVPAFPAVALARTASPVTASSAVAATPARGVTWGSSGSASTLVVYDSTNSYGWLGELYAIAAGNLAGHFGKVTAEPVVSYVPGQLSNYTATIYIGSTYNEPIPAAFLNDVLATTQPVIWAADNVWQLSGAEGSPADQAFKAKYGWDPSNSYFDTTDNPLTVSYKGQTFSRNANSGAQVLAPSITNPAAVTVLAQANCANGGTPVNCAPIAQTTGTSFPWAIRSANLTYVGEVPFSYMSESDRYVAFSDLLFPALAPSATPSHLGLVRLEDVNPTTDPAILMQIADYLSSQNVPFSVNVIPQYTDPNGIYNGGTPRTVTLAQAPSLVAALKYVQSKGGTLIDEGYTHQYSNVANPYDGASGDDAEFYRARCATTPTPPYTFEAPCQNSDSVIWTGPLPGDSSGWATGRALAGSLMFTLAGLGTPKIWVTPHYFASAADYAGIDSIFKIRYEREIFASGQLGGQPPNYSRIFGQFFPYQVHDAYGEQIIPENLGDYEPVSVNNNPPRLPADLIHNAQLNLAVTQGVASFFFDPNEPFSVLQQVVTGIKALGYTFTSPTSLPG